MESNDDRSRCPSMFSFPEARKQNKPKSAEGESVGFAGKGPVTRAQGIDPDAIGNVPGRDIPVANRDK